LHPYVSAQITTPHTIVNTALLDDGLGNGATTAARG